MKRHPAIVSALLVIVALVIAMATVGPAYSLWSTTLAVGDTAGTGTVDVGFSSLTCLDGDSDPLPEPDLTPDGDPFGPHPHGILAPLGPDVSRTVASINATHNQISNIEMVDAYPGNANECRVSWVNIGTTPVFAEAVTVGGGSAACPACSTAILDSSQDWAELELDGDTDGAEIWVQWVSGFCQQLNPSGSGSGLLRWHQEQGASPDVTYNWTLEILLVQWNETQCP